MILAIDVGNTDITFGTVRDGVIGTVARVHTERDYTVAEYGMKLKALLEYYGVDPLGFEGAILASVVPPVTNTLRLAVNRLTGLDCLIVGPGIRTGLNVRIDDPGTLAADLVVGSVAARSLYGEPAIVLELKYNRNANSAIDQILRRQYPAKVAQYAGDLLLVGVNYDREKKTHECQIQRWKVEGV